MANRAVTLLRYCRTDAGWKRLPVAIGKNGKIRPGYAMVDGVAEYLPEGYYVLRTYEGKRTVYASVGPDAAEALAEHRRQTGLASLQAEADSYGSPIVSPIPPGFTCPRNATSISSAISPEVSNAHRRPQELPSRTSSTRPGSFMLTRSTRERS